ANHKVVVDEKGEKVREPGMFKECKATGWYIEEYKQAQVTMNLTNYKISPPHLVFDACCDLAREIGCRVTGSELVGLIPKEAMLQAGRHYLDKQGASQGVPEKDLIQVAIKSMSLDDISEFDPEKKIIESYVEGGAECQTNLSVSDYLDEVSRNSPAPGGGAVAALCGSLSSALASMVANLTYKKKGYKKFDDEMNRVAVEAQELKKKFLDAITADTEAFNLVMKAMKMKKDTDQQKKTRAAAMEEANKEAALSPLGMLRLAPRSVALAEVVARHGNKNALSDSAVSAVTARTAAKGAWYNVMVNLGGVDDQEFKKKITEEANELLKKVEAESEKVEKIVQEKLGLAPAQVWVIWEAQRQ
ncbi:MAG: cyclodeaminase/cyclohydrolase family protein, partial [Vulcanimicrobiota bacterium]